MRPGTLKWFDIRAVICVVLILSLHLSACSEAPTTAEEVKGVYKSNHPTAEETLVLHEDGTYTHQFTPKGGQGFLNKGKWRFKLGQDARITFERFIFSPLAKGKKSHVDWPAAVFRIWGTLEIEINTDSKPRYFFEKVQQR